MTQRSYRRDGRSCRSWYCLLSCLVSSGALSIALLICPSTVALDGGSWRRSRKEKSTWMAKVGGEGDSASSLTGVQVERGFAPTGPSMEKLGNSCLDSKPV